MCFMKLVRLTIFRELAADLDVVAAGSAAVVVGFPVAVMLGCEEEAESVDRVLVNFESLGCRRRK